MPQKRAPLGSIHPTDFAPEASSKDGTQVSCTGQFGKLLRTLGKPHTLEIVYGLSVRSPMRFSEIQRELKIQPKTLTNRLHELVKIGVLERTTYNEIPPRVDYALSQRGRSLGEIMWDLKRLYHPGDLAETAFLKS
jgi:DNA-binding HxlR family transcriptional regulator